MKINRFDITSASKLVLSACFLLFLIGRLVQLNSAYLKFVLIEFIYQYNLGFLFWILALIEVALPLSLFLLNSRKVRIAADILIYGYFLFFIPYYLHLLSNSVDCIDCKYRTSLFGEDIRFTFAALVFMLLLYSFFARGSRR
jgi:hypothetical protein